MPLKPGNKAPDFSLPSTSGESLSLYKDQANKPCILYFYPKDFTAGCTAEACDFRDNFDYFNGLDVDIFGISRDNLESHHKFREAHHLPFHLLSDTDGAVAKAYKALIPIIGITNRVTYLLDGQQKIAAVYESLFGARNHLKEMIAQVSKKG